MSEYTRLPRIRAYMDGKGWVYRFHEDEGVGVLEFIYRDRSYHIWEYRDDDGSFGAESNVLTCGRMDDYTGDYEQKIIDVIEAWIADEKRQAKKNSQW